MYFIALGGESVSTNKFGCPDPVALSLPRLEDFYTFFVCGHSPEASEPVLEGSC